MVRQRKFKPKDDAKSSTQEKSNEMAKRLSLKNAIAALVAVLVFLYFYYSRSPAISNINVPLNAPLAVTKKGLQVPNRYWGTYRPGLYFGTKTRSVNSLETGLAWFKHELVNQRLAVRHWCDQANNLPKYGWLRHNGINFGEQQIVEDTYYLNTTYVKRNGGNHGGDWSIKVSIFPKEKVFKPTPISLVYYISTDQPDKFQFTPSVVEDTYLSSLQGISEELGRFIIRFPNENSDEKKSGSLIRSSYLVMRGPGLHTISEIVEQMIVYNQQVKQKEHPGKPVPIALPGNVKLPYYPGEPNVFMHEITIMPPYEFEVVFESESFMDRSDSLSDKTLNKYIDKYRTEFDEKFEDTFGLKAKGFKENEQQFAKAAISNMLGGIGYFSGTAYVQAAGKPPVEYWPTSLYSAVPSRSFFPRGFLWDEGFHNLLISRWDSEISRDIINHWLDLMNIEGWIPREVILGNEAQARVPQEFIIQRNNVANPPTFFLTIHSMIKHMKDKKSDENHKFLKLIFPRLQAIYNWMSTSQKGKRPGTYYWRGRNQSALNELNPKTLASGLDDYPRASHPDDNEAHLDLRCWIALASSVLADIAEVIGEPHKEYLATTKYLSDNEILDQTHWSEKYQRYLDYGMHSDNVRLVRPKSPPAKPGQRPVRLPKVKQADTPPTLQFVNNFGYVSLFPFLLQIIKPDSPKLGIILNDMTNRDLLWTNYGLRSLSRDSPLYMKHNTDHDPPYWRGPVWININFLAVRALHHYSSISGPHQVKAKEVYEALRSNIIKNMVKEYERTGYIWEQYHDGTSKGQGVHPFTGWSSLVVLMMSEKY